ncbi:Uncharacterised protein [Mycobacteroides abscessus subsp. bolletii]|uniref:hypothetical protein n=1 Tax=Mycobacteroides abscessus TaxID=36809 RepID=UPI0009A80A8E|nr:hypothetical protein [Mycobacteroides abscessus]SKS24478.1 Uncharacterised protein [Mycobacteroides abscessus subsp. bolletii]SKS46330.1 Uncharacterised protein [Mycobacteroides abscessus subsp. bolletii]
MTTSSETHTLRDQARNRIDWCEGQIEEGDDEEVRALVDRNLAVAKAKVLLSIADDLAGIRRVLNLPR